MFFKFWESLSGYLVSPWGVFTLCVVIVAFFLFLLARFYRAVSPVSAELKQAVALVTAQPAMVEFSTHLQEFSEKVRRLKNLGPLWREFYETLVFPQQGEHDQFIRHTKEVSSCFNENTILAPNLDLPFYAAVPNYLTCSGILGTFSAALFDFEGISFGSACPGDL